MIKVVSAVIISYESGSPQMLLAERMDEAFLGSWECPGGKVNPHEGPAAALRRELMEELGAECEVGYFIAQAILQPPQVSTLLSISFFRVDLRGIPRPLAARRLGWFGKKEFGEIKHMPGQVAIMNRLMLELA